MGNYCTRCGSICKKEWTGAYCEDTGEKEYRHVCADNPCHTRCDVDTGHPWASGFMAMIEARKGVCRRCSKKHYLPGG